MGTWAAGSFDNDASFDWVIELSENPSFDFIEHTLQVTIDEPRDPDNNQSAIAACEVVSILYGHIPRVPEEIFFPLAEVVKVLEQKPIPKHLAELALKAIESVEKESELRELWQDDTEWKDDINALKAKLKAGQQ